MKAPFTTDVIEHGHYPEEKHWTIRLSDGTEYETTNIDLVKDALREIRENLRSFGRPCKLPK